ncbi:helix-turn-helix transcriptional regulator [Flavobacterium jejuense]|uniref:Helix-turn-helix transcriptional regulator n=1 Tax=Flavobacterium jejuense TaxID=1544455 RepID=A0ABX0ILZ2_9FLAO|nr:helix-turn-helix transcriptional regulator [Flavobacterium jejuense]NHN24839.1 helix-turn-helix transcriptional regulator [Flavobacterium jejuense]
MNYQIFEVDPKLKPLVKCYWTLENTEKVKIERQTIVPDGCMEMIFHYRDLYKQYLENGNSIIQPKCFVIGQLTRPLEIEPTGKTGIFSVRFQPNGFLPFTTVPIKEIENTAVSLEKLFGKDGKEIEQKILRALSTSDRIKLIETFLFNRLTNTETFDRIIKATVETILTANGKISIDELSKKMNINRRQLERKFSSAIGLSPKQLSKIIRLQATLKMLLNKKFTNLTTLAYENEYYDQAHFIKDFKEMTGFTPKEFYGSNLQLSSLFYGID